MRPGDVRTGLGEILPELGAYKTREKAGGRKWLMYTIPPLPEFRAAVEREFKIDVSG